MLLTRRRDRNRDGERGVAMVVVVMLVVLCATVTMVVASSSMFGTVQTATDRARLQALSAAEAGRDSTVAALQGTNMAGCHPAPYAGTLPGSANETYTATVHWAPDPSSTVTTKPPTSLPAARCPDSPPTADVHGWIGIKSTGSATGAGAAATKAVVSWYDYKVTLPPPVAITHESPAAKIPIGSLADGGLIEGGETALSLTSPVVHAGDAVLNSTGSVDCNSGTVIDGDLVLPRGGISLSNACQITGDLIAYGDVHILNLTAAVGGNVISTHGSVTIEGATIGDGVGAPDGDVKAYGGVTLNNSVTIRGNVVAEGNGDASSSFSGSKNTTMAIKGSVNVGGGGLAQLDFAAVGGSVNVSSTGGTKIGSVAAPTAGSINLAGTCSPCTVGPGTPKVNQGATVPAPTFPTPTQMSLPTWADYAFNPGDWTNSVYQYQVLKANSLVKNDDGCSWQGDTALISKINALTQNTVIDARACPNAAMKFFGVSLALNANVTFVGPGFSAQSLQVTSADSKDHYFNLITPDDNPDGKPTCTGATSTIAAATMDSHISGMAYTPCELDWGSAGGSTLRWNGQIMAGNPKFSGNGSDIYYSSIGLPGGNPSYPPTIPKPPVPPPTIEYVPSTDPPKLTMAAQPAAQTETGS